MLRIRSPDSPAAKLAVKLARMMLNKEQVGLPDEHDKAGLGLDYVRFAIDHYGPFPDQYPGIVYPRHIEATRMCFIMMEPIVGPAYRYHDGTVFSQESMHQSCRKGLRSQRCTPPCALRMVERSSMCFAHGGVQHGVYPVMRTSMCKAHGGVPLH